MSTTVVINDSVAREGIATGVLELTPAGYRFTDPDKFDVQIQVVYEDSRAVVGATSKFIGWRPSGV